MSDISFITISTPVQARITVLGSRFYSFAYPVLSPDKIDFYLTDLAVKYPDATHHCYAWRYGPFQPQEFTRDDGEPAGTAGQPILGVIKSEGLINVLIVVIRYFGGTKLGKPGLIRAYREAASNAVTNSEKKTLDRFIPMVIHYAYEQENRIRELINRFQLILDKEQYLDSIMITVYCRSVDASELQGILEHLAYSGIEYDLLPECFRAVERYSSVSFFTIYVIRELYSRLEFRTQANDEPNMTVWIFLTTVHD